MKKVAVVILILSLMLVLAACGGDSSTSSNTSDDAQKLTLAKFEQVENGMTYEQVVDIIGCEGTLEAESGEEGTDLYTVSYRYMGDDQVVGTTGANASFMFQGGKLNTKAQTGLE